MQATIVIRKEVEDSIEAQRFLELVQERLLDVNPIQTTGSVSEKLTSE